MRVTLLAFEKLVYSIIDLITLRHEYNIYVYIFAEMRSDQIQHITYDRLKLVDLT